MKQEYKYPNFKTKLFTICEKEKGNFIWVNGAATYYADENGKIFFATVCCDQEITEFPSDGKANLFPSKQVEFYKTKSNDITKLIKKNKQMIYDGYDLKEILGKEGITKLTHRPINELNLKKISLKQEIQNCYSFVSHMISRCLVNESSNYLNYFEHFNDIVFPIIDTHFSNFSKLPASEVDVSSTKNNHSLKKGDILFFRRKNEEGSADHVGFFYGYNKKNKPLIFDLWGRTRCSTSTSAITSFSESNDYKKYDFEIRALPLDTLIEELIQKLQEHNKLDQVKLLFEKNPVRVSETPGTLFQSTNATTPSLKDKADNKDTSETSENTHCKPCCIL